MLARGQSTSVSVRHGKVESSERSEDFDIGLRVFVGQQTASISTSQLDPDNIKELASRAVTMAKLAPEWASFPTYTGRSAYGQPAKSHQELASFYSKNLNSLKRQVNV